MQLRHLRYFIAIAEEGSVLRAARRLHVAQPSVSKQIQDLEREVGCALFERMARGVRLTPAGEAFLLEARCTVENAARAVASARSADAGARSGFSFAAGRLTYYPSVLTELLARFHNVHPDCAVQMHSMSDIQQKTALRVHSVSAAVAWMCDAPAAEFASYRMLDCSLQGVLLPAAHPLAQQSFIKLAQLQPLTRLHHPRRIATDLYRSLRMALLARGLDPLHHKAVPVDATSIFMHIASGDAYIVASELTARSFIAGNSAVVYRRFAEPAIPLWLTLFWRANDGSPLVRSLVDIATDMKWTEAVA